MGFELDGIFERRLGSLSGLLEALARTIVQPPMVRAAQAFIFGEAVFQIYTPVSATLLNQTQSALAIFKQGQGFSEQANSLHGIPLDLLRGRDRVPVPAHQLANGCPSPYSGQHLIFFNAQHNDLLSENVSQLSLFLLRRTNHP
jgi:hypothetical protein